VEICKPDWLFVDGVGRHRRNRRFRPIRTRFGRQWSIRRLAERCAGVRRKITPADMPQPYATASANNGPTVLPRPNDAWPKAPPSFVVELLASGLDNPRLIRVSPSGDVFVTESRPGRMRDCASAKVAESQRSAHLWRTSISRSVSPSGRRDQAHVMCMSRIPIALSAFRIMRAILNQRAQQRRLSPV